MVFVNNKELLWSAPQARTFGFVQILPGVRPFFIYSKRKGMSHWDMVEELAEKLEGFVWSHEDALGTPQAQPLLVKYLTRKDIESFIIPDVENVAREILSSRKLINALADEDLLKQFNRLAFAGQKFGAATNVKKEMNYAVRSKILKNAGRIWLKEPKVCSFWSTSVDPNIIEDVFNYFQIPRNERKKFFIDVIDLSNLKAEETNQKKLPSFQEYTKTKKPALPKPTKEDQKKAHEIMSATHGQPGQLKAKFKVGELPFKYIPLNIKQQAQTSESLKRL